MAEFSFGTAIMCDAVYKDQLTNKAVLAGVYSGYVLADAFPITVPVAFYLEVTSAKGGAFSAAIKFLIDGKEAARAELEMQGAEPNVPAMILLQPVNMSFPRPCTFEIQASANKGRFKSVVTKEITLRNPSALPPPS